MKYNFNGEELKDLDERTKNENYKLRICVNKDKLRTVKFKLGKKIIGWSISKAKRRHLQSRISDGFYPQNAGAD